MKYILFTIAFLLASNCLKAQGQFEKVIGLTGAQGFPQPGVSNANTQGKIPVGLYTGTPNISIPLDVYKRQEWERTNQQIKKGTKSTAASPAPMPEPPEYYHLCGAPSTSRNQIIRRLKINGDLGLIICATELDMISGAIKQDYGKHDDVFRAAYHHEPVATDYKVDGELICAEVPRLALCLSGTPSQLANFIRSLENGLYCRFGIYTCGARWKYRSAAPIKGQEDYITLYKGFGKEVLEMYFFFQQSPTEVTLSDRQWEEHTAYFDCLLNEVASEQADAPGSIVPVSYTHLDVYKGQQ